MAEKKPSVESKVGEALVPQPSAASALAAIAESFIRQLGGPDEVAKMLTRRLRSKRATAATKHRIVDMVINSLKFLERQAPPERDLGLVSEEDLQREAAEIVRQMAAEAEREDEEVMKQLEDESAGSPD